MSSDREHLIKLIIDVGMMRRDVATDVADAILTTFDIKAHGGHGVGEPVSVEDQRKYGVIR